MSGLSLVRWFVILAVAVSCGGAMRCECSVAAEPTGLPAAMLRSWAEQRASVTSFQYVCDVVERRERARVAGSDPFGLQEEELIEREGGVELELEMRMVYTVDGAKRAVRKEGDWETTAADGTPGKESCDIRAAFDGKTFRDLYQPASGRDFASIHNGAKHGIRIEGDCGTMPLWTWYDPAGALRRVGCDAAKLAVVDDEPPHEGVRLVRLSVTRPGPSQAPRRRVILSVDAEAPHRVHELAILNGARTSTQILLKYSAVGSAGGEVKGDAERAGRQAIGGWEERWFRDNGSLERVTTGRVVSFRANETFGEEEFQVLFPLDTPVVEYTDDNDERRYYLQGKDGLDTITGDEFSRAIQVKRKAEEKPKR